MNIVKIGTLETRSWSASDPIPDGWAEITVPLIYDETGYVLLMVALTEPPYLRPYTEAELLTIERKAKRQAARAWRQEINSRAFKERMPGAVDEMITQDNRLVMRAMINMLAEQEGLSARIDPTESKEAFKTRPRFAIILMAGEATKLMIAEINAITDLSEMQAYSPNDAKAATLHAADNPTESPTLEELLETYPADYAE